MSKLVPAAAVFFLTVMLSCGRAPYVNSLHLAQDKYPARPDTASVLTFLPEDHPDFAYEVIGTVEVSTERKNRKAEEMLEYARKEARKMGGDALIDIRFQSESGGSRTSSGFSISIGTSNKSSQESVILRTLSAKIIRRTK